MVTLHEVLQTAMAHHTAGRLAPAEALYRSILSLEPDEATTLHLLGALCLQKGDAQAAFPLIVKSIAANPNILEAHGNLAELYRISGRPEPEARHRAKVEALRRHRKIFHASPFHYDRDTLCRILNDGCEGDVFFVQIGAMDGSSFDPLHASIRDHGWKGILVEPLADHFAALKQTYAGLDGLIFENAAIAEAAGEKSIFRVRASDVERHNLPEWVKGTPSFQNNWADGGSMSRQNIAADLRAAAERLLTEERVACMTLNDLLAKHAVTRIDLLQIDTEGHDWAILRQLDLDVWRPAIINVEHLHLGPDDRKEMLHHLVFHNYAVRAGDGDLIATNMLAPDLYEPR